MAKAAKTTVISVFFAVILLAIDLTHVCQFTLSTKEKSNTEAPVPGDKIDLTETFKQGEIVLRKDILILPS